MTAEVDFLKKREMIEKYPFINFLKIPSNFPLLAALSYSVSSPVLFQNSIQLILSSFFGAEIIFLLGSKYKTYMKDKNSFVGRVLYDKIKNTEEFKKCEELYNEYIVLIANILKVFNFESSKEMLIFLQHMLDEGFFSVSHNYNYYEYKKYYEYVKDLLGAGVMTGKGVCRHTATFFNDVLKAYGETSAFLIVGLSDKNNIGQVLAENVNKFTHAVVGIKTGNEKYLYDPTHGAFIGRTNETDNSKLNAMIGKIPSNSDLSVYYQIADKQMMVKWKELDDLCMIQEMPMANVSAEEITYYSHYASIKFMNNMGILYDFYLKNFELVKSISQLISKINPAFDEELKEWKLTKSTK